MKIKDRFAEIGKDVEGFMAVDSDIPEGLTPKLLWNLWDICVKFSIDLEPQKGSLVFGHEALLLRLYDFRNQKGGIPGLEVFKMRDSGLADEGIALIDLINGIRVVWDSGLTVDQVQEIVVEINVIAKARKDTIGNARLSLPIKYGVDSTFDTPGMFVPMPSNVSDDEFLELWDNPGLLGIATIGDTKLVFLKGQRSKVEKTITVMIAENVAEARSYDEIVLN